MYETNLKQDMYVFFCTKNSPDLWFESTSIVIWAENMVRKISDQASGDLKSMLKEEEKKKTPKKNLQNWKVVWKQPVSHKQKQHEQ